ncbi:MAG: hypothetical protein ACLQBD_22155 [Syntrophobacteraceae bacterium]
MGVSYIMALLRDTNNAPVEDGATMLMVYFWDFARKGSPYYGEGFCFTGWRVCDTVIPDVLSRKFLSDPIRNHER